MAEAKSIKPVLLNSTANFVAQEISYVVVNGTIILEQFDVKQINENVITIEYEVTPAMTNLIRSIRLMRADSTILTDASVYVPVTQTVISKHTITVKEGV